VKAVEAGREAVVQHFSEVFRYRRRCLNVLSEKRQTERCYARSAFAVTPLLRRRNAVRSVEALQHRNSLDSVVLLRQKPSEKERGVSIGTAVGRLREEEIASNSATSSAYSLRQSPCVRFVGLYNSGSQSTGIELLLNQ